MTRRSDPAKAFVMGYLGWLVVNGYATWDFLDNGDILFSFNTGEAFLLAKTVITRVA